MRRMMTRNAVLAVLFSALWMPVSLSAWQESGSSSSTAPSASPQDQQKQQESKDKKDKKKKDDAKDKDKNKDKDSGSGQDVLSSEAGRVFNRGIAEDVLGRIRDGLEGHSQRLLLSAFDDDKMDGYLGFEDQIDAYFRRYDGFRVHFRIADVTVEGDHGVVLVDAELEEMPYGGGAPVRKAGQLRFELEKGRKGWRVIDMRDRNFFS